MPVIAVLAVGFFLLTEQLNVFYMPRVLGLFCSAGCSAEPLWGFWRIM
jgi:hypothetical protein